MDLSVLAEDLDRLSGCDPSVLADAESIEFLHRQLARLEAVVSEATAAFDAAGNWVPDGARNAVSWLVVRCRLSKAQARRTVRRGRALRHLGACARAWSKGDITGAQVDVITDLRTPATEEALARDEEMLVGHAAALPYRHFARVAAYWKQLADPDGADRDDEERRARRDVYLEKSFGGMWLGKMTLDPVSGSVVAGELDRLERRMFEADWAGARDSLGREPTICDLARTPGQRRADALVEMASRSHTAPGDDRRLTPLLSVLIDYPTMSGRVCELADGTVVSPGSLLALLDEAFVERVVFTPGSRIEVSATARLFSGATRRAIELRDRECAHPYCDVPADKCDADHIVPWTEGGLTVQENGRMLCGPHNRMRNGGPPPDG